MPRLQPAALLLFVLASACAPPPSPAPRDATPPDAAPSCDLTAVRTRADRFDREGRLDRAAFELEQAEGACPREEASRLTALLDLAEQLDDRRRVVAVHERVTKLAEPHAAPPELVQRARKARDAVPPDEPLPPEKAKAGYRLYQQAGAEERAGDLPAALEHYRASAAARAPSPAGRALIAAAEVAQRLGDSEAQRLFDRGLVALEREEGARAHLALHSPLDCYSVVTNPIHAGWLPGSDVLVVACGDTLSLFDANLRREVARAPRGQTFVRGGRALVPTIDVDALPEIAFVPPPKFETDPIGADATMSELILGDTPADVVAIWSARARAVTREIKLARPIDYKASAALSADGKWLAVSSRDSITLFDASGKEVKRVTLAEGKEGPAGAIAFAESGDLLIYDTDSGPRDPSLRWSPRTGRLSPPGPSFPVSPDGRLRAEGASWPNRERDKGTSIRDVKTKRLIRTLDGSAFNLAFSPSGAFLAGTSMLSEDGGYFVKLWQVDSGAPIPAFEWTEGPELPSSLPPDGKTKPLVRGDGFTWEAAGPFPIVDWYERMSGPSPRAVKLPSGEIIDFERDELPSVDLRPSAERQKDVEEFQHGAKALWIASPTGPIDLTGPAAARALHCRVGRHVLPLDACISRFRRDP